MPRTIPLRRAVNRRVGNGEHIGVVRFANAPAYSSSVSVPDAPVLTLDSYTNTTITVSWPAVSGATSYKVYKDGVLVDAAATSPYAFTGLTIGTSYALTAKAVNAGGDSAASNTITQSTSPYPTLSDPTKQLAWIDFLNKSKSDASGLVACSANDPIYTVPLPSGWDVLSVGGLVIQSTLSLRPTWRSGTGAQSDGATTKMSLPATISLPGTFTIYVIGSRTASNQSLLGLGKSADGGMVGAYSDGNRYCYDPSASNYLTGDTVTGLVARRFRRTSSNVIYSKVTGVAEHGPSGTLSGTYTFNQMFARSSDTTASAARLVAVIAVKEDVVATGNNTAIETAITSLYGVSL